ncbi:MAG: VWA domain-containing protein [Acidobacteriota bacterium]
MSAAFLRYRWTAVLALLVLVPGALQPAMAEKTAKPSKTQGSASSDISVTLVEVPVEVTRGDTPVTGLTAADFEVTEGKRALPIVAFEPIDLETPAAPGTQPLPPAARRHLLFLFDFAFSQPHLLAQGITSAREMVARGLDPRDMVAIGTYLPKGELQLLLSFTTDRAAAERTLAALEQLLTGKLPEGVKAREADPLRLTGMDARTLLTQAWRVDEHNFSGEMLQSLGFSGGGLKGGFLQANVLAHSAAVHQSNHEAAMRGHITAMAAAFDGLADTLRPVTGRKYLALFSDGFSMNVFSGPSQQIDRPNTDGAQALAQLERTLQELKRSGWILHSVELAGTRNGLSADGLFFLADQTGGSLVEGTNDLAKGLGKAMRRSAHAYLISVQADDVPLDGAYHKIEVRLRNAARGVSVHHRGGYYAPLPFARQDDVRKLAEAARLVAGDDEQDDLGIQVVAVPLRSGPESTPVAVLVEVPGDRLLAPGSPRLGLEVYGYALGEDGTSRDFFAQSVDMDPARVGDRLAQGGVRVLGKLDLPPGRHRLRVLVRDRNDGRSSILTIPLAMASESRIDALFLPPAEDPWLVVRPTDPAFDLHGRSVLPAAQASLPAAGEAQLLVVGHGLAGDEAVLRSRILDATGRPATGGEVELLAVTPGESGEPDMVVGRLNAGSLPPGAYLLELRLGRQVRATAVTARPFSISARK